MTQWRLAASLTIRSACLLPPFPSGNLNHLDSRNPHFRHPGTRRRPAAVAAQVCRCNRSHAAHASHACLCVAHACKFVHAPWHPWSLVAPMVNSLPCELATQPCSHASQPCKWSCTVRRWVTAHVMAHVTAHISTTPHGGWDEGGVEEHGAVVHVDRHHTNLTPSHPA